MEPQDRQNTAKRNSATRTVAKKAYKVFVTELQQSISAAKGKLTVVPSPETAKQLSIEFHKIKGGAGFFGLNDVAKTAGQLQTAFVEKHVGSALDQLEQAIKLLGDLESLSSRIPRPEE